jgi:hypothetical protein
MTDIHYKKNLNYTPWMNTLTKGGFDGAHFIPAGNRLQF